MIDFDNAFFFQGIPEYLFNWYGEWFAVLVISMYMCFFNDIMFDIVREFFGFSKVESVSTFFTP